MNEALVGLAVVLVVIVAALVVVVQRRPDPVPAAQPNAQPVLTAAEIREAIREVHGETLRDLADQAKTDRNEVIDTA
ncbi:MAG: hypothetical protein ACKODN_00715, partial [Actinomycetota bacterium]